MSSNDRIDSVFDRFGGATKSALSVLECHLLRSTFGLKCFPYIAFPADGREVLILVFEENKVVSAVDFLLSDRRLGGFGAAVSGAGDWEGFVPVLLGEDTAGTGGLEGLVPGVSVDLDVVLFDTEG